MAESAGLNQLHPGVFSTITADQTTYETATGVTTMFVADVFDKGEDGKINFVTTPEEFIFKYGEPNYAKYGQSAYNVINFLRAGGQAYVMRILPDDATFAHSILNVQTRIIKNGKKIELDDLSTVTVDDVHIRPTVSLVRRNNLSEDMLVNELMNDRSGETTVDGYDNNFLLLVMPHGRGESYNSLGYRLTPNHSFSSMIDSQVYNFEVVKFEEGNVANLVEGPFYVTFDPDAVSDNQESMFIEDVINRQSEYLKVRVNLDAFANLAKKINPEVKSTLLDVVTGGAFSDDPVTRFNSVTGRYEDIHLSLHKYNSVGQPVLINGKPVLNTPEPTDPVQTSLVSLDNGLRESDFIEANNKLEYMKSIFPTLSSEDFSEFKDYVNNIFKSDDEGILPAIIKKEFSEEDENSTYSKFLTALEKYEEENSEENLNELNGYISSITEIIRTKVLDYSNRLSASYSLVEHNSPNAGIIAKYNTDVSHILDLLARKDQINIFSTEHRSLIYDIQRNIFQQQLGNVSGSALEGIKSILNSVENEINFVYNDLISIAFLNEEIPENIAEMFSEDRVAHPESLKVKYINSLELLSDIENGIQVNNVVNREKIFAASNSICNELLELINQVAVEVNSDYISEAVKKSSLNILSDAKEFTSAIHTMIKTDNTYNEHALRENARQQIQIEISAVNNMGSKFFNTNLVDFNNSMKLLLGSDGSFEYKGLGANKERNESIKRELIKAYSGATNIDVLNTDLLRFNVIFDARYPNDVKKAIANLARNSRRDFLFFANDAGTEFTFTPQDALDWRAKDFNINSEFVAIHAQDLTYYDEYTGKDIRFTPTYVLASKIPQLATQYGLHYPLAGTRRGTIDGFKHITWTPDEAYREKLYKAKVNYIQQDSKSTRFNSQLTTINSTGPVSYINNMFTILEIKRGCEDLLVDYQFEFNDDTTITTLYTELNNYLSKFTSNRSCESITSEVTSSDYDRSQRILRVRVNVKFTGVVERIVLDLNVQK